MIAKQIAQKLIKLKPNTATDSFAKAFHNNPDYFRIGRQFYSRIYDNGAVGLEMYPFEDKWHLADIHVAPEHRGKGLASQTLEEITQLADQHGVNMDLDVVPHGEGTNRLNKNQLFKWYGRHGFERIPYSMEPAKLSETMERTPKKIAQNKLEDIKGWEKLPPELQKRYKQIDQSFFGPRPKPTNWYHASKNKLPVGAVLLPHGAPAASERFYNQGFQDRAEYVWLTPDLEDAYFWATVQNASYIYEVKPQDEPKPWNGTGVDGWITSAATIVALVENDTKTEASAPDS